MIASNGKRFSGTPFVVTEGRINFLLMEALLLPEFDVLAEEDKDHEVHVAWAHGWSGADSLARTIQVTRHAPVALVVGADSLDPAERLQFLEISLGQYGERGQSRAIVVTPTVERLLFAGNG